MRNAESLLEQLINPAGLSAELLRCTEDFFAAHDRPHCVTWMRCEREGYGENTEPANLRELLGQDIPQSIIDAVLRSRLRYGRVNVQGAVRLWPHFFVENVDELCCWGKRIGATGPDEIVVALATSADTDQPLVLCFHRSVFADILSSIALEIADVIRTTRA